MHLCEKNISNLMTKIEKQKFPKKPTKNSSFNRQEIPLQAYKFHKPIKIQPTLAETAWLFI
uniref:Uncharacterized protein n=1 Tax=Magnetococcus massalia (strain MO-1) TaxID=451514 RepID=A0A1S7LFZ9_MAGMO|nr:protein of unknown function [Candidatus Magnetococcus massalia]